ncbi:hypothetical protein NADFUDRAFT_52311 [Nadsonia fulvescens var. elongata DSM 6958]|uniref:Uncharacterized protein n=1 Tax=Nadsonia fulvescens var. elongata DSM 6958 TaxID=857566 RepID=A0A1E3PIB4_9ASCO|nr:hypothetical protein NADFUDRAFT_52311 [Nadsonia fulvescens var. elongata DSM 6958]
MYESTFADDYAWHFYVFIGVVILIGAYWTRARWSYHAVRFVPILSSYRPLSLSSESFQNDIQLGLSSANFDLETNVNNHDPRAGLDDQSKQAIQNLMDENDDYTFDRARLVYSQQKMLLNEIDQDGMPRDPKAIFFNTGR